MVQRKTVDQDGYEAVQIGLVEERGPRHISKPLKGHFEKAGVAPMHELVEFDIEGGDSIKAGDQIMASVFTENDYVDVVGTSKGKGFQGTVSVTTSAAAARATARCTIALPARSAPRLSRRVSSPACAWPAGWATTA